MSEVELSTAVGLICTALAAVIAITIFMAIVRGLIYICRPSEILIFAGRKHRLPDGTEVGYRVVRQRLGAAHPAAAERVAHGHAAVHGRGDGRERLLQGRHPAHRPGDRERQDLQPPDAACATRSSASWAWTRSRSPWWRARRSRACCARCWLAADAGRGQRGPPQVRRDACRDNAKDDFDKLGLELDVLKVQHVSDEQKYLQNLGRARIALMIRDAQNAENEANQKIAEEQAAARQRAQSAQKKAEGTVLQKRQPAARGAREDGGAGASSIENEAAIAAETARASAEQELQRLRAELEKLRLRVRRGAAGRGGAPGRRGAGPRRRGAARGERQGRGRGADAAGHAVEGRGRGRPRRLPAAAAAHAAWSPRWRGWRSTQIGELLDRGRRGRRGLRGLRRQLPGGGRRG